MPAPATEEDLARRADQLRQAFDIAENKEKSIIFADSLANLYLENGIPDSAAMFIEVVAQEEPGAESWRRAGNAYYEAFTLSDEEGQRREMATRARTYFEKVIEEEPDDYVTKNKLAMTMLASSNPMAGIMMLRQIVEDDPENEIALFNLGALSMQSNQYDKAVERFEQVIRLNPGYIQAQFFLGVSYLESGQKQRAREQFELVKSMDTDPEIQAAADSYLERL
jgi:tetratricopeptide (TPR) repeat protein